MTSMPPETPTRRSEDSVIGIDLAGSPKRRTGLCVLSGKGRLRTEILWDDDSIVDRVVSLAPRLVLIDAPLSLPRGRKTIDDRGGPHFRQCDRELRALGIRFFPVTLGPMRMLTTRGLAVAARLRSVGLEVYEGYPGGAQDLLGIERKSAGEPRLQRSLLKLGLRGDLEKRPLTHDELDAVTLAWVARRFLEGHGQMIGDPEEGVMVLPEPVPRRMPATTPGSIRTAAATPRSAQRRARSTGRGVARVGGRARWLRARSRDSRGTGAARRGRTPAS